MCLNRLSQKNKLRRRVFQRFKKSDKEIGKESGQTKRLSTNAFSI